MRKFDLAVIGGGSAGLTEAEARTRGLQFKVNNQFKVNKYRRLRPCCSEV